MIQKAAAQKIEVSGDLDIYIVWGPPTRIAVDKHYCSFISALLNWI